MTDLLFDSPWWVPVFVAAVGVGIFVTANRRQKVGVRSIGAAVSCLAVLLVVLKFTVDTPKKAAVRMSRALVASVVSGDWARFESLLEPRATLRVLTLPALYSDAAQITRAARDGASRVHLHEAHTRNVTVEQTGPLITVTMDILSEQEEAGAPIANSAWQFEFEEGGAGWRIREIRALKIGGLPSDQIENELPRR